MGVQAFQLLHAVQLISKNQDKTSDALRGVSKPVKPVNACPTCNEVFSCPPAVQLTIDCIVDN